MTRAPIRSFAFALPFILCACGGVRWHKAETDEATLARDLAACQRQTQDRGGFAGSIGPATAIDPRFGGPTGPSQADQLMRESQSAGYCMRDKGYVLVPDGK